MKIIKIYKVKLKDNIFRQLIFTDKVLLGILLLCVVLLVFITFNNFNVEIKFFISFLFMGLLLLISSINFERQSLIQLLPRILFFILRRKNVRF